MKVYLSVDLDYFIRAHRGHCDAFFEKVYALRLPIFSACEHHHLLKSMGGDFDTLINVDFHSDLCDTPEGGWRGYQLCDGTWGNFVPWRRQGTFIWRYPNQDCLNVGVGYCHDNINPFEKRVSGWREARKQRGVTDIPWKDVKAVGVCLSPTWIGPVSTIQEPIERLEMQDWLGASGSGYKLVPTTVKIIPPRLSKRRKRV